MKDTHCITFARLPLCNNVLTVLYITCSYTGVDFTKGIGPSLGLMGRSIYFHPL